MHQPAFLSKNTISYTTVLPNPTQSFLDGLLAWISASVQDPIEVTKDPAKKEFLEGLKKSAEDDPFGQDAKIWHATMDSYEQFRKDNRAKALDAIGGGRLFFVFERNVGAKRLLVRTPTEILGSADFPPEIKLENIQMAVAVVLSIYGPKISETGTGTDSSSTST